MCRVVAVSPIDVAHHWDASTPLPESTCDQLNWLYVIGNVAHLSHDWQRSYEGWRRSTRDRVQHRAGKRVRILSGWLCQPHLLWKPPSRTPCLLIIACDSLYSPLLSVLTEVERIYPAHSPPKDANWTNAMTQKLCSLSFWLEVTGLRLPVFTAHIHCAHPPPETSVKNKACDEIRGLNIRVCLCVNWCFLLGHESSLAKTTAAQWWCADARFDPVSYFGGKCCL